MAEGIFMPKLSSTMQEGTLLQWLKEEGDSVEVGEPLFEIMTDKINIEVEAYEEGVLLKKYYEIDEVIPINTIIGYIGEPDESVPDSPPENEEDDSEETSEQTETSSNIKDSSKSEDVKIDETDKVRATPAARRVARENDVELSGMKGTGAKGRIHEQNVYDQLDDIKPLITPLAEKMVKDHQLNASHIKGTGARGKIEKDDVEAFLDAAQNTDKHEAQKRVKLKGLRKAVADKMLASAQSIPHVTLTTDVDMTEVIAMRKKLLPAIKAQTDKRLSFTEIIMKVTAHTLTNHPAVNASLIDDEIVYNQQVNLGLAVAVENGLIVPSIHDVDRKGLAELTEMSKDLGLKARDNKLLPDEMQGSTFTISNLGMYAIDGFTPIINPPETAILGVGRITEKPIVENGELVIRPVMVLSLSFDHRAIDGAPAAAFLTDLKMNLEYPYSLLI